MRLKNGLRKKTIKTILLIMNDKEKIKHLLVDIDSFLVEKGGDDVIVNWDGQTPRSLLEFIKKDLEKILED